MGVKGFIDDDTYTEKDQIMIELAARGSSQKEIAEQVGITPRHVARELSKPKFKRAIRQFCRDLFENRMRHVQGHWDKMEKCFVDILDDDKAQTFAKIAAATQIRSMCFQAREFDIEDELDELRQEIADVRASMLIGERVKVIEHTPDDE